MITLYYAKGTDLEQDVQTLKFKKVKDLLDFVKEVFTLNTGKDIVYLSGDGEDNDMYGEIFTSQNLFTFYNHIESFNLEADYVFFLHEYESYESAYKVALDMREINELCYDKD